MCGYSTRVAVLIGCLVYLTIAESPASSFTGGERIVGGENTTIEQFPFQISLRHNGRHTCGGSVYRFNIIITAAHCISQTGSIYDYTVMAGGSRLSEPGIIRQVIGFRIHPKYANNPTRNDIALLFLSKPLYFSKAIQPITLPKYQEHVKVGTKAMVTGWGTLSEGGSMPDQLQSVAVHIVSNQDCAKSYGEQSIYSSMICAGVDGGGKDSCQNDSGGPLTVGNVLVGIVSWGYGCARPNYPGVYARLSELVNWIDYELEWFPYDSNKMLVPSQLKTSYV